MSKIEVTPVKSAEDRSLPIFAEIDELFDKIRDQAYQRFALRGFSDGNDIDDWLSAERELCWPEAELQEDDDEFEVKVALAGFKPEEIELTATPGALIIKASHEQKESSKKEKVRWSEFRHDDVYRRVALPVDIDVDKVKAELEDGLLKVDAKKAAGSTRKSRAVRISSAA